MPRPDPATLPLEPSTMTLDEVAADLRLTYQSVLGLAREGVLPAYRLGRYWRVNADDYAAWKTERARRAQRLARMGA